MLHTSLSPPQRGDPSTPAWLSYGLRPGAERAAHCPDLSRGLTSFSLSSTGLPTKAMMRIL